MQKGSPTTKILRVPIGEYRCGQGETRTLNGFLRMVLSHVRLPIPPPARLNLEQAHLISHSGGPACARVYSIIKFNR